MSAQQPAVGMLCQGDQALRKAGSASPPLQVHHDQ